MYIRKAQINIVVTPEQKEDMRVHAKKLNLALGSYLKFAHAFWKETMIKKEEAKMDEPYTPVKEREELK